MESCIHNGKVCYISRFEDFRDVMESSVFECLSEFIENLLEIEREDTYQQACDDVTADIEAEVYESYEEDEKIDMEKEDLLDEIAELETKVLELESEKNSIINNIDRALQIYSQNKDSEALVEKLERLL